jgi:hypothetical protein
VAARADRAPVAGVQAFDGVGAEDDPADLGVVEPVAESRVVAPGGVSGFAIMGLWPSRTVPCCVISRCYCRWTCGSGFPRITWRGSCSRSSTRLTPRRWGGPGDGVAWVQRAMTRGCYSGCWCTPTARECAPPGRSLLRQYFPKGTDLSVWTVEQLDQIASELNNRPRLCLKDKNPHQLMRRWNQQLTTRPIRDVR